MRKVGQLAIGLCLHERRSLCFVRDEGDPLNSGSSTLGRHVDAYREEVMDKTTRGDERKDVTEQRL
jgi:hypothetical protein